MIRGGTGKYFADVSDQVSSWTERYGGGEVAALIANDGRADFAREPVEWQTGTPTYEQALRIPGLRKVGLADGESRPESPVQLPVIDRRAAAVRHGRSALRRTTSRTTAEASSSSVTSI